jgi:alpha-L-fucosidase 2
MVTMLIFLGGMMVAANADALPFEQHGLQYDKPAMVWDEAMPLGNAILGALVWGDGQPLNISLDRTDLWDLRPVPEFQSENYKYSIMRQWEKEKRFDELLALYDEPYNRPAPTKIPAGRMELVLPEAKFKEARLTVHDGIAEVQFADGAVVRVWVCATEPVGMVEVTGATDVQLKLKAPAFGGSLNKEQSKGIVAGDLTQLGYLPPNERVGDGFMAYTQQGWEDFSFAVHVCRKNTENGFVAAWSIASSFEEGVPAELAQERAEKGLANIDTLRQAHDAWWQEYWQQGYVSVPNKTIERQWYLDMYKFGAAARRDAPPITLQGPWTADDGKLPPWKGDYHHDLNTQLSYWPCYSGNRLDAGLGFLDWLWANKENARDWTQRFFEMPGLNVPMTTDLELKQIGGWRQYTHSATTAAWLAHHFYLHWQYSQDRKFLEERAYPWLEECAVFLEAITSERDADDLRTLPLSASPEINDNKPNAWFPTMTNYDNALIRWTFEKTAELADELDKEDEAKKWRDTLSEMPALALADDGGLLVAKGYPLEASHRHLSHQMAVHPLGIIDRSHGASEAKTIKATLDELKRLGTDWWCGYSFSWLASVAARAGDGKTAADALELFARAFVLPSSFHCNGDQTGEGHSKFTYRPFTLEGNFAYAAGLNEMLIQSHTGVITVFPAIPDDWQDVSFNNLRAVGAFLVSAERKSGKVVSVTIKSETGAVPVVQCPWSRTAGALDSAEMQATMNILRSGNQWILTHH